MTSIAEGSRLYGSRFAALLAVVALGFGGNALVQPILPLLILDRGGDATLVGIVMAAFSIPSVVLRPFIGRLVDEWSRIRVLFLGTLGLGIAGVLYLVPGLPSIIVGRVFHGTAWAGFNTGGNSTLYEMAPSARRGEAAGVYNLMPGLAHLLMPGLGLLLLGAFGFAGPFGLAAVFGFVGAVIVLAGPIPRAQGESARSGEGFFRSLIERRAILPMLVEFLWTTANTLFFVYPPLFAASRGIPLAELALYYPAVGLALVGTRLVVGRRVDRFPRGRVISVGALLGIIALLLAGSATSVAMLAVAGAVYAAGTSATSPIATALAMDRADPRRRGAAMATYSLGYQLGIGSGAAIWGFVIDTYGFPAPYYAAILAMVILLALMWTRRADLAYRPA